ncbi:MAG: uncharacterized protein KVP18_003379 [Porospora cf. gigantea A]|uniref:uncharacterized protein n=1 Tax=Porospora cf. gigantea A TaxID=2853593 RepID=UPI003559781D|nr:MAG: hypothetical protein KVP18_003379 [Porospora cf. gigantea A]
MHRAAEELESHQMWQDYHMRMARYHDHVKECQELNVPSWWRRPPTPPLGRSRMPMEEVLRLGGLKAHDSDAETTAAGFDVLDL